MNIFKRIVMGIAAVAMTVSPLAAAQDVRIESTLDVANVTGGVTPNYQNAVNAKVDDVVRFQVWYHNMENENSGKIADDLTVKLNVPKTPGKTQTATSTVSAKNSNTVTDTATVNLTLDNAYLEVIPGSAKWRHNAGTNAAPNWVTTPLTAAQEQALLTNGLNLEDAKPCFNFEATVTVEARVKANAVSITKKVRKVGETEWKLNNEAKAGDTLEYLITFKNEGNTVLKNVKVGDNLPPHMTYVNGSTMLKNGANPNGIKITSDNITKGGIDVGNYNPGAVGYVWFQVKIDPNLPAGCHEFKNVGIVRPEGMNEFFNVATTKVCVNATTPPAPQPPVGGGTLPQTGIGSAAAATTGAGALFYSVRGYLRSKRSLLDALKSL
jgi:uncharacterized repeat protein (TIGR01451 family)